MYYLGACTLTPYALMAMVRTLTDSKVHGP